MATPSISALIRSVLSDDPNLETNEVIRRVKARGGKASDESIRHNLYNLKSILKKAQAAGKPPQPVPSAARETPAPRAAAAAPKTGPAAKAEVTDMNLAGVLANVALVNKVVDVAGGVEQARQVAEAVRCCGGVEGFLQHLELVAGIRGA